jgi:hypothetical protein
VCYEREKPASCALVVLKRLEDAQTGLAELTRPEPSLWDSPWAIAGIVGLVTGTVLLVVYRDEVKRLLAPKRAA